LSDLVAELHKPFEKIIIDDLGYGGPQSAQFVMTPQVHDQFIRADDVSFCTDGAPKLLHPRSAGTFARVLEDHVGAAPRMTLERAVYKMTGLAAQIVGLSDRGVLASGKKADLVVLTLANVRDNATWADPLLPPSGFDVVLVNGAVAMESGKAAGRHGTILRRNYPRHVSSPPQQSAH
jgi:N-acyl-D-aspartate/D-glutamate deacylase